jgi:hypothetical protein
MREQEFGYCIHDLLSLRVLMRSQPWIHSAIHTEYQNFFSNAISNPDLTVIIGNFEPDNNDCTILDNTFHIKQDYIYCKDSYKRAHWKFELTGLESGHTKLKIYGNFFARFIISGFLIDPIINFKLNEKGYSLVHGSSVCNDRGSHIFTAQGGGGKTSTALYATERGCQFMGDNFIIVHNGQAMSFLSPLNIFSFNMLPYLKQYIPWHTKFGFHVKKIFFLLTGLNIVTKINPEYINICSPSKQYPICKIFMLVPHERFSNSKVNINKLVQHMAFNLRVDFSFFTKYLIQYSFIFPNSALAKYWNTYEENLTRNFQNIHESSYLIEVPQKYDLNTFEKIWELIK